jgi:hypothetical protein
MLNWDRDAWTTQLCNDSGATRTASLTNDCALNTRRSLNAYRNVYQAPFYSPSDR